MSKGIPSKDIPPVVLSGMKKAAKSWNILHGTWAYNAPEYWFTVTVAQHLQCKLDKDKNWIMLESGVKDTMFQAGVVKKGPPKKAVRSNGKCDIVIAHANEKPFAVIEVKTRAYAFYKSIAKDITRLQCMLQKTKNNSIKIACLALYFDASDDKARSSAKDYIERRFKENIKKVKELCKEHNISAYEIHGSGKDIDSDDCWAVQCLYMVRK